MNANHLVMAILMLILLLFVNAYVPLAPVINLVFNCLIIVCIILYVMQCLGIIKPILPAPRLFK